MVGDVDDVGDLGHRLPQDALNALGQGLLGHAASLATPAQLEMDHRTLHGDQVGSTAVLGDAGVDLGFEGGNYPEGQGAGQVHRRLVGEHRFPLGSSARGVGIDHDQSAPTAGIGGHVEPGPVQSVDAGAGDDHREIVIVLDDVTGTRVMEDPEVHVVDVGIVVGTGHLEPQGQPTVTLLVGECLDDRGTGLGGNDQRRMQVITVVGHACHHKGVATSNTKIPTDAHEWVSFDDPDEERTWQFDVTFLTSAWTCIFGHGCQGVLTGPAPELVQGCCSYGAHFTGKKDARTVERAAAELTPDIWQFYKQGQKGVVKKLPDGDLGTRLVKDACIFLNRPGFSAGAGCALHLAAMAQDRSHVEMKPEVCWQLPLRREDETSPDGHVTSVIRQWDRRHWGGGGEEFHWWCTEAPEAFVGHEPVYVTMRAELEAMAGKKVYKMVAAYLDARLAPASTAVPLPHPTVRRRTAN